VDNAQGEANVIADALQIEPVYIAPFVALPFIFMLLIVMLVSTEYNRRRKKIREKAKKEYNW
jgi:sortase A